MITLYHHVFCYLCASLTEVNCTCYCLVGNQHGPVDKPLLLSKKTDEVNKTLELTAH